MRITEYIYGNKRFKPNNIIKEVINEELQILMNAVQNNKPM